MNVDTSVFREDFCQFLLITFLLVQFSSPSFAQCSNFVKVILFLTTLWHRQVEASKVFFLKKPVTMFYSYNFVTFLSKCCGDKLQEEMFFLRVHTFWRWNFLSFWEKIRHLQILWARIIYTFLWTLEKWYTLRSEDKKLPKDNTAFEL